MLDKIRSLLNKTLSFNIQITINSKIKDGVNQSFRRGPMVNNERLFFRFGFRYGRNNQSENNNKFLMQLLAERNGKCWGHGANSKNGWYRHKQWNYQNQRSREGFKEKMNECFNEFKQRRSSSSSSSSRKKPQFNQCYIDTTIKPMLFCSIFNNNTNNKTCKIFQTHPHYKYTTVVINNHGSNNSTTTYSDNLKEKTQQNYSYNRQFHSSTPNQFNFLLSKTVRILVPLAMSGVRTWIGKGSLWFRLGMVCAILVGTTGVYLYVNQELAPVTNRPRLLSLTRQEEQELGKMGYDSFKKTFSSHFLPENNPLQNKVRGISKRLIEATGMTDVDWECYVINHEIVNAMVLPNGKIFVFTGLFNIVDSEDELAAVIGHEIGHVIARHSAERLSMEKLGIMFLTLTRGLVGDTISGNVTTLLSTNLLNLKYSRIQELEADIIGLELMTKANYNPQAAISIEKKLAEFVESNKGSMDFDILSTHPSGSERIQNINKWIQNYEEKQQQQKQLSEC